MSLEQKKLASRCQNLLKEYGDILVDIADKIKKESEGIINGVTTDEIALEYKRREGVKYGVNAFVSKINSYANERPSNQS